MRALRLACVLAFAAAWGCTLVTDLDGLRGDGGAATDAPVGDASDDGDALADAGPPRCDPSTPFSPVGAVAGLAALLADEQIVRLTPNELEAYVWYSGSGDGGLAGVFHLDRPDTTKPFANGTGLGVTQQEPFGVSPDGLELVAASFNAYDWTRPNTATNFSGGSLIAFGGVAGGNFYQPYLVGKSVLYGVLRVSDVDAGTTSYVAARSERGDAGWGALAPVDLIVNTSASYLYPVVSDDELVVYFAQIIQLDGGPSAQQMFVATRTSATQPFDVPKPLTELGVAPVMRPAWISPDLCHLYYVATGKPAYDVYLASRSPP